MDKPVKLTKAQSAALKMVERRDWPAGEPRADWINKATAQSLLNRGLIAERAGTARSDIWWRRTAIVDLTPAGRAALKETPNG